MNIESAGWSGRARPLSACSAGGRLWALAAWLRRPDHSSSDSVSSAGSDRSAASFAFLPPGEPAPAAPPAPPSPPGDTYRRRLRERSLRRHRDRDLTLHRKYGLPRGDATLPLPDARGLPFPWREDAAERLRRAAHVPGKRRAPPPPATLPARHARKRPAPQPPPGAPLRSAAFPSPMNPQSNPSRRPLSSIETSSECKPEKYSKKNDDSKMAKPRREKSFLKQIFENKKRNSAIEPAPTKILPNISELDKQAAEIIESYKLRSREQTNTQTDRSTTMTGDSWFCTKCLKKYNSNVITCLFCISERNKSNYVLPNPSTSAAAVHTQTATTPTSSVPNSRPSPECEYVEKQKLKDMLKEMKHSLPKKTANINDSKATPAVDKPKVSIAETPTLKIGTKVQSDRQTPLVQPTVSKQINYKPAITSNKQLTINVTAIEATERVVITQPVVMVAPETQNISSPKNTQRIQSVEGPSTKKIAEVPSKSNREHDILSKPLRISSLLNPVYVPKNNKKESDNICRTTQTPCENLNINSQNNIAKLTEKNHKVNETPKGNVTKRTTSICVEKLRNEEIPENIRNTKPLSESVNIQCNLKSPKLNAVVPSSKTDEKPKSNISAFSAMQHSRRRELINQLEQSIAKGEERAAADAAAKLAQLRLSCSVLSFSSQIAGESSRHKANTVIDPNPNKPKNNGNNLVTGGKPGSSKDKLEDTKLENQSNKVQYLKVKAESIPNNKVTETDKIDRVNKMDSGSAEPSPSTSTKITNDNIFQSIDVWIEDREATRGPVRMLVSKNTVIRDLRQQSEKLLGVGARLQRWIIGRTLCNDDNIPITLLAGNDLKAPFYLCLVEETKPNTTSQPSDTNIAKTITNINNKVDDTSVYNELVKLEQQALVSNGEPFECGVCMEECAVANGVVLRECVHTFCRSCLSDLVKFCEEPAITCPAVGCSGVLQEREIRALVSQDDYNKWLARGLAAAESGTRNAFHCRTRDCTGWALCDPGVRRFPCPVCKHINCVPCQAIHEGATCDAHRARQEAIATSSDKIESDGGTRALLDSLIAKGEALECPECKAIITKKWGCDWVKCSACKTEICWVTRGRRWGPGGRGDTSGGCRCGVDGKRCHPSCGYCH